MRVHEFYFPRRSSESISLAIAAKIPPPTQNRATETSQPTMTLDTLQRPRLAAGATHRAHCIPPTVAHPTSTAGFAQPRDIHNQIGRPLQSALVGMISSRDRSRGARTPSTLRWCSTHREALFHLNRVRTCQLRQPGSSPMGWPLTMGAREHLAHDRECEDKDP